MKLKSSSKLNKKYNIDEVIGNKILVNLIDLSSEVIEEHTYEEVKTILYVYDSYQIEIINNEQYIIDKYDELLANAKVKEYNEVADEVRNKRKRLLEETDNYAMSDRVMSDNMKQYRQDLRDITAQQGFPYNVIWPIKPEN